MANNVTIASVSANVSKAAGDVRVTNHRAAIDLQGNPIVAPGDQVTAAGIVIGTTGTYHIFSQVTYTASVATHGAGYWKNGTLTSRITTAATQLANSNVNMPTTNNGGVPTGVALVAGDVIALNAYSAAARTLVGASNDPSVIAVVRVT